jgi:hypothetical protein
LIFQKKKEGDFGLSTFVYLRWDLPSELVTRQIYFGEGMKRRDAVRYLTRQHDTCHDTHDQYDYEEQSI